MKNPIEEALFLYEGLFACPKVGEIFKPFLTQLEFIKDFTDLMTTTSAYLDRQDIPGHITASAFIISKDRKKILLNHHGKINKWMQLGGHADGNPLVHEVAMKEACEESGLKDLSFYPLYKDGTPIAFDIDIHVISAYKGIPEHKHYDIRYLFLADNDDYIISNESFDLKWVPFEAVKEYTQEVGFLRSLSKIQQLLSI